MFAVGCGGGNASPSSDGIVDRGTLDGRSDSGSFTGAPSIRGTITLVDGGTIRVEEVPAEESGSAKATVRVDSDTPIRNRDGSPAAISDLAVGEVVAVWFTGPVAESYPVQARAGGVEIGG